MGSYNCKNKVVFILGATGTGKSKISIDLALRFSYKIINSSKMQIYKGLDIITNKVSEDEKCGVKHHLLGVFDPDTEFTTLNYRDVTLDLLESIAGHCHLPIIVGGSNSYIEALVDVKFRSKFECCFIWLDVKHDVLDTFVFKRVDDMVKRGLVDEVRNIFDPKAHYNHGIRRSIGVLKIDQYLRMESIVDEEIRNKLLRCAIDEIKTNTSKLTYRQREKIQLFVRVKGWNVHLIDATNVLLVEGGKDNDLWEEIVFKPATLIIETFLKSNSTKEYHKSHL